MPDSRRCVLIYTNRLLPYSETFIRDQAEGLYNYRSYYVGCREVKGISLDRDRIMLVNRGGLQGYLNELSFKLFGAVGAIRERVAEFTPHLIHAHFGDGGAVVLPFARARRLPLIVTFHGLDATRKLLDRIRKPSMTGLLYLWRKRALKVHADRFITVTKYIRDCLIRQGFPEDKIAVNVLGIDNGFFSPDPEIRRESVVLFVGRLVEKKGCEFLIRAMHAVQQTNPELTLVVIGDGRLRADLEQLAARLRVDCRFIGVQSPASVKEWMNRARIFSVPSVTAASGDIEGFGVVFIEAQAMGTPVVATQSGGIPEAVADGETGILVPEKDVVRLADSIVRLASDEALWSKFSQAGRRRALFSFDRQKQTERLERIYDSVLDDATSIHPKESADTATG